MVNGASMSDKMQGYLTPVLRMAMLAHEDSLPLHPAHNVAGDFMQALAGRSDNKFGGGLAHGQS